MIRRASMAVAKLNSLALTSSLVGVVLGWFCFSILLCLSFTYTTTAQRAHTITAKKYEGMASSSHNVQRPFVQSEHMVLIDIEDGYLSLLDDESQPRNDLVLPDETHALNPQLGERITTALDELKDGKLSFASDCALLCRAYACQGQLHIHCFPNHRQGSCVHHNLLNGMFYTMLSVVCI